MDTETLSHKHRRRTTIAVAAAILIAAGGAAVALTRGGDHDVMVPPIESSPIVPIPPAGTKWVGVGRTVVAVPKDWPVIPAVYCSQPATPYVTIVQWRVAVGCVLELKQAPDPPSIHLSGNTSGKFDAQLGDRTTPGEPTRHGLDVSRTTLPDGWLAVPSGEPDGGVGDPTVTSETDALRAAGFRVEYRHARPDSLGRAVTTDPEIGSPTRVGTVVVVYDHGAAASSARLRGRLEWVGGPAGNPTRPHPGTVRIESTDYTVEQTVGAGDDGRWSITLPPGTYRVTATSPGYLTKAGKTDACTAERPVTVSRGSTERVNVYCQLM